MARRGGKNQGEFGSDSFLDIVANIVGILIILIVIAGLRVSQAPFVSGASRPVQSADASPREVLVPPLPVEPNFPDAERFDGSNVATTAAASPPPVPEPQVTPQPSPELLRRIRQIETELEQLEAAVAARLTRLEQTKEQQQSFHRKLGLLRKSLAVETTGQKRDSLRLASLKADVDSTQERLDELGGELDRAMEGQTPVKRLKHKLTPISSEVTGHEIHFRLAGNRVAEVPIEELIERLRPQVARQMRWLVKYNRHEGRVGPVRGFTMTYLVERQALSVLDELRSGRGMVRIAISRWQIEPERDLESETLEQASRPGSAFVRALMMANPDATITFWVYPDSFPLYRGLQELAHGEGFTVAARPLPFGVRIAGSPNGSRSAGQ
jgi:hypothetical protein